MTLIELIDYLLNPERLENLYEEENLNTESDAIIIYMKYALDLECDVVLFEMEETEDEIIFEKDGIQYFQLFPVEYAIELIESDLDLKGKGYSNLEIAERLLEYRVKDA
ncbi:hypothetical protein [Rurimicrobium arvi]|uniref:Uncharacterized protein n=1 Tax=Rurimicrobium arvi TaxID=2049916 RepID=A0ABP8N007_9BACT